VLGGREAVGFLSKRTGDDIGVASNSSEHVVDAAVALK
jgi:hypothetical protein